MVLVVLAELVDVVVIPETLAVQLLLVKMAHRVQAALGAVAVLVGLVHRLKVELVDVVVICNHQEARVVVAQGYKLQDPVPMVVVVVL